MFSLTRRRTLVLSIALILPAMAPAQVTYVGNLNGTHQSSTMEAGSVTPTTLGWEALSGTPRVFNATNDAIINGDSLNFNPYSLQYLTGSPLIANSTYTLSVRMGYFASLGTGGANYQFELGTWNGSSFTSLQSASGGPVSRNGLFSDNGNNSVTVSLNYSTGASVSSDQIAIRWAQTNTNAAVDKSDFFGFDNVTLSYSAVPEPSTYAGMAGGLVLAATWIKRRRRANG